MPDTFVVSITQRETVKIGGREYTLRPISYGEDAELEMRRAGAFQGGAAMFFDILRQALRDKLKDGAAASIAAVDEHEDADTDLSAILLTQPHAAEPAEAHAAYREEKRRAQVRLMKAARKRAAAEALVADVPEVLRAKSDITEAQRQQRVGRLRTCLVGWKGDGLPEFPADGRVPMAALNALPAADMEALVERAAAMRRPGVSEGKG